MDNILAIYGDNHYAIWHVGKEECRLADGGRLSSIRECNVVHNLLLEWDKGQDVDGSDARKSDAVHALQMIQNA